MYKNIESNLQSIYSQVKVKNLIHTQMFKNLDLIVTEKALDNQITSVTIMDVENILDWLNEGEALIMGQFMKSHFSTDFILSLIDKKASCIITKKKFKNFIKRDHIDLLNQHNMPVIIIEDFYSWSDVIVAFQNIIIETQTKAIIDNVRFQESLIKYLSNQHTMLNICDIFYQLTDIPLAIIDTNMHIVDYTSFINWRKELKGLAKKQLISFEPIGKNIKGEIVSGFIYHNYTKGERKKFYVLPKSNKIDSDYYVAVKVELSAKTLSPDIISKIEIIQSIYSLKNVITSEIKKSNMYFKNFIFEEMLRLNKENINERKKYSLSLDVELKDNYYLVQINILNDDHLYKDFNAFNNFFESFKDRELSFLDISLYFVYKEYWVILIDANIQNINEGASYLLDSLKTFFPYNDFTIGVSNIHPYWDLYAASNEAQFAINYLDKNYSTESILLYDSIGIIRLFTDNTGNINTIYIEELYRKYLKPILDHDTKNNTNLYQTLMTWFANNMSYKKTSEKLFIHINTLRSRLEKIENTIHVDLNSTDVIMNLRLLTLLYQLETQ